MRRRFLFVALPACVATAWFAAFSGNDPRVAHAAPQVAPPVPTVAVLAGRPEGTETAAMLVPPGGKGVRTLGTIRHAHDATVRGALLPDRPVMVVVADQEGFRDRSWRSALFRLEEGKGPALLADRVAQRARPVLTPDGHVLIERGDSGDEPVGEASRRRLRIDAVALDEIDPDTGDARTLYSGHGYTAYPAGAHGDEALVYRVGPDGADLIAVRRADRTVRVIVPRWPAAARDFSVDRITGTLVVQQARDGSGRGAPHIERVDLATGARTVLFEGGGADLVPLAMPGGRVLFSPDRAGPPSVLGGGAAPQLPLRDGFFWPKVASVDGAHVAGLIVRRGELPEPVLLRVADGAVVRLGTIEGARMDVAGLAGSTP
jgi:hypothetical protein